MADLDGSHSLWYYTALGSTAFMGSGSTGTKGKLEARVKLIRSIFESSKIG